MTTPPFDLILTQPCPHCGGLLPLYVVSRPTPDSPATVALARPHRLPPTAVS